jgi:HEAT repeat protein
MDLEYLKDAPPWEWPPDAGDLLLQVLRDGETSESDRLTAVGLAGDFTVVDDDLVAALLSILSTDGEADQVRARAAIALGPALESADMEGFGFYSDAPISEPTFHEIQKTLHRLYLDTSVSKEVRRRVLEAAVRAPQDWQEGAVQSAYGSEDAAWKVTAVFCMRFLDGFDEEILESLDSGNLDIQYEAVCAAGEQELQEAWPHITALVTSQETPKSLLLAAIGALSSIRPQEAAEILDKLVDADDQDVAWAAAEAMVVESWLEDEEFYL